MQVITTEAPAKINLYLKVLGRRQDGYHELDTVMAKLGLSDRLTIARRTEGIRLQCLQSDLPENEDNLAVKAARIFFATSHMKGGVDILLEKKIPVAAGLGGGSSDAAAVLLTLNKLFDQPLQGEELLRLGGDLGADVPFFISPLNCVRAGGIGEILSPVRMEGNYSVLLVNPGFAVATRWVYENFALTTPVNPYILGREWQDKTDDRVFSRHYLSKLTNDLESVTCARHPAIVSIKDRMRQFGALAALMSGSGPTVFALFDDALSAQRCSAHFSAKYETGIFVTRFRQ